ncbi:uncharacterized protein LY79DRAFT_117933 [Colletotrichum navitas]|uniref:Uncharacterized protein n=1 Tax=Colletotrichum navitas TaxID=681940 RepID=A0AAD8Q354_9PEZI|nr:uncharacterized protein LY79DRAFT_117933 [Colletotrichum navitas]KAK1595066.1 hypothetical protein LY79DRAFT_117933 [Colletotrichum navitas]
MRLFPGYVYPIGVNPVILALIPAFIQCNCTLFLHSRQQRDQFSPLRQTVHLCDQRLPPSDSGILLSTRASSSQAHQVPASSLILIPIMQATKGPLRRLILTTRLRQARRSLQVASLHNTPSNINQSIQLLDTSPFFFVSLFLPTIYIINWDTAGSPCRKASPIWRLTSTSESVDELLIAALRTAYCFSGLLVGLFLYLTLPSNVDMLQA